MSTALQMVNRVLRMHRAQAVTAFSDDFSNAVLDELNRAVSAVLDDRWEWEFAKRDDGQLSTVADLTDTIGTVNNGSTAVTVSARQTPGSFRLHLNVTDDSVFSNTAFPVASTPSAATISLASNYPGTTNVGATDYRLFAFEYTLPSTVREVTSVRYEEDGIELYFADSEFDLYRDVPRFWSDRGPSPSVCIVGGIVPETIVTGGTQTYGTRIAFWPRFDVARTIHYSYICQPEELSSTTDELMDGNVPRKVEDLIVRLTFAYTLQTVVGNDTNRGLTLEARTLQSVQSAYASQGPVSHQKKPLRSLDHVRRRRGGFNRPQVVPGY